MHPKLLGAAQHASGAHSAQRNPKILHGAIPPQSPLRSFPTSRCRPGLRRTLVIALGMSVPAHRSTDAAHVSYSLFRSADETTRPRGGECARSVQCALECGCVRGATVGVRRRDLWGSKGVSRDLWGSRGVTFGVVGDAAEGLALAQTRAPPPADARASAHRSHLRRASGAHRIASRVAAVQSDRKAQPQPQPQISQPHVCIPTTDIPTPLILLACIHSNPTHHSPHIFVFFFPIYPAFQPQTSPHEHSKSCRHLTSRGRSKLSSSPPPPPPPPTAPDPPAQSRPGGLTAWLREDMSREVSTGDRVGGA